MLLICFFVNVRYNFQSRLMFILYFLISLKLSNMTNYSLCYVHMHSGYLLYKVSDKAEILKCTLLLTSAFGRIFLENNVDICNSKKVNTFLCFLYLQKKALFIIHALV